MVPCFSSEARPSAARSWSASSWRKNVSPKRSKICGMGRPADSSIRSSRSTKRQASCRARSVPTVVLPEPIKPARQKIGTRGGRPREGGVVVTRRKREGLVTPQDSNCTTVGGEFDLGQACAESAHDAFGEL